MHSKPNIFQFKRFAVDQSGCAMKVNTDGVLLGALSTAEEPQTILDIGTGTGAIALMMAQRYPDARVDAVEIDAAAASTAGNNFRASSFHSRCICYPVSFSSFFDEYPDKQYDLIVSNPPFFINSLEPETASKRLARHAGIQFFADLLGAVRQHLNPGGRFTMILPVDTSDLIARIAADNKLYMQQEIHIASFGYVTPHRKILTFGHGRESVITGRLDIYADRQVYSDAYRLLLKDFLTIF